MIIKEKGFTKKGKKYHDHDLKACLSLSDINKILKASSADIAYHSWGSFYAGLLYDQILKDCKGLPDLPRPLKGYDRALHRALAEIVIHYASMACWTDRQMRDWHKGERVTTYPTIKKSLERLTDKDTGFLMYLKGYRYVDESGDMRNAPQAYMMTDHGLDTLEKVIKRTRRKDQREPVYHNNDHTLKRLPEDMIPISQGGKYSG